MFFPRRNPSSPDTRRFAALRTSLNAPVVATEELPSGPARAAIVLWFEGDGETHLEVRMHSVSTGRVVVYGYDGTLDNAGEVETSLEAALSFAESMGFLFDDDILSGDDTIGREKVVAAWASFEGREGLLEGTGSPLPEDTQPEAIGDEPLDLTELAVEDTGPGTPDGSGDDRLAVELASGWAPEPPAEQHGHEVPLTKFRGLAGKASEAPEEIMGPEDEPAPVETPAMAAQANAAGKVALGRVPLVRRQGAGLRRERPSLLARILGAF